MRRALGLLAGLAVWAGAAAAAPFDRYQLIMWQEHSPAEVDGLKRLGFTALKLRATGGEIGPAELSAHLASGLPWYLENIATDLYASYHRYTPDQPVNWRYHEAVARRRAAPDDASVFLREPSLSDPDWRDRVAARLQTLVAAQEAHQPLYYNLADEAGIADLAAAWDFDLGAESLAGLRSWLQTQYPSLDALNAEWGTLFERWDAVMPELTDAALRRTDGNYAAWADFKAWMDVAFAQAVRAGADALHQADPAALAGLEGGQVPGWGGYDYSRLAPAVDVMEIYDIGDSVALAHAFAPDLVILRTSFAPGDGAAMWRSLLQGGRGTIVWDEGSVVEADGAAKPRGAELAREKAAIDAVAPAIMASRPAFDPVAILVSQASFRTAWLLDRQPGGRAWSERDAGRENEDNAWRASRREALQRLSALGLQPRLLSSAMLEQGALARDGTRVLLLPHAIALSDEEVAAVARFAAQGGTVIADTEPGLFDGHSRHRAAPPLAGVARLPEPWLRTGLPPDADALEAAAAVLAQAGVTPRVTLRGGDGRRAAGVEARWLRGEAGLLLSLQAAWPGAAPAELSLEWPTPVTVRDLRHPGPPQTGPRTTIALDPAEPTILAVSP